MINITSTLNNIIDNAEHTCEECCFDVNDCLDDNVDCRMRTIIDLAEDAKQEINKAAYCHR